MDHLCIYCEHPVRERQEALLCDGCQKWQHRTCNTGITQAEYREAVRSENQIDWRCTTCSDASTIYEPPAAASSPIADVSVRSADESSLVDQAAASSPIADVSVLSADESSLLDPAPGPVEPEPFRLGFTIVEDSTLRRKRKLIDNAGYTYNVKRQRPNATDWQCTVRPKVITTKLLQKKDY